MTFCVDLLALAGGVGLQHRRDVSAPCFLGEEDIVGPPNMVLKLERIKLFLTEEGFMRADNLSQWQVG